jgi:hypothetical protein
MNKNQKVFMWYKVNELWKKGLNKSQIRQELGLDRSTIRKYLSMTEVQFMDWINAPRRLPKKLTAYYDFIKELLLSSPYLSAAQVEDRLKEAFPDLPGVSSKTIFNFVKSIRDKHHIPKHKEKLPRQYQKLPEVDYGEEAQVDFGSYRMQTKGSGRVKVYFFVMVLSRSRYKFVYCQCMPFTTQTANYAHELAFEYFEGIPRRILYDQDRVFVTDENLGDILLTEDFMHFTNVHPFEAVFCRKADPESKGKVENVVKYVKNNFLKGRVFYDIDSLQSSTLAWLKRTGNARVHGTTRKIPAGEWEIEKTTLLPFHGTPEKPFMKLPEYTVRKDNTILYRSNYYSLPVGTYQGHGSAVLLEEKQGALLLYSTDEQLLATHTISFDTGKTIRNTDHARAKSKSLQQTHEIVLHALGNTVSAKAYLDHLEKNKPRYYHDNLKVVRKSICNATDETVSKALLFCNENNVLNGYQFAEIVKHYQKEEAQVDLPVNIDTSSIKAQITNQEITPQTSSVEEYESIIKKHETVGTN